MDNRLDRDVKTLHGNFLALGAYDIVHFEKAGQSKRPFVPYEAIEATLEISTSNTLDVAPPA